MIKVLHSELEYRTGGIESFLLNLSKTIDRRNVCFEFLMRGENKDIENKLANLEFKIHKVPQEKNLYIKRVSDILKNGDFDIIHIHKNSAADILLPILAKHFTNAKIIIHAHNTMPSHPNFFKLFLHRINRPLLCALADKTYACSDLAAQWLYGKNYMSKNNVSIIKNGIIVSDYQFDEKKRNAIRNTLKINNYYVLGHVGAFRKQKNHHFLIEILNKINDPDVKLMLIGWGPLMDSIKKHARNLGVENQILFMGNRTDVNLLLQAMDIFLMPSFYEGFPVSVIEAQAAGLPVALSKHISKQCKLTNNVSYLDINDINEWTNFIIYNRKSFMRNNTNNEISSKGYDMICSASYLELEYKNIKGMVD